MATATATTTATALAEARHLWAEAQRLDTPARWAAEAAAWEHYLAGLPPETAASEASYGLSIVAPMMEGDRDGWAFPVGFSVKWYPTRGQAKRAWYHARNWLKGQGQSGALGPKPVPCTEAEAIRWQG